MQIETVIVNLTPALYRQFLRLKALGSFQNDQDLMQAALEALEREWRHGASPGAQSKAACADGSERYMRHPGLGPEDYDT